MRLAPESEPEPGSVRQKEPSPPRYGKRISAQKLFLFLSTVLHNGDRRRAGHTEGTGDAGIRFGKLFKDHTGRLGAQTCAAVFLRLVQTLQSHLQAGPNHVQGAFPPFIPIGRMGTNLTLAKLSDQIDELTLLLGMHVESHF